MKTTTEPRHSRYACAKVVALAIAANLLSACSGDSTFVSEYDSLDEVSPGEEEVFESETLLHETFAPGTTIEEADELFDVAVSGFMDSSQVLKARSHAWNYRVCTTTGRRGGANTDDDVRLRISFLTDWGSKRFYHSLNNAGDDREFGQVDCYLKTGNNIRTLAVSYVEIQRARLQLKGTDGWFVERFTIDVKPSDQPVAATGRARMSEAPKKFLDNGFSIWGARWGDATKDYSGANDGRLSF